ncbi:MAG: c-type cytochrome [Gammaproteobacteria bacterium]
MSNHDDSVFVRNFSLVLVGLCVIGILAFILAKVVSRSAQENYIPSDGVAARVAPMGQVNTGPETLSIAATAPAPAPAAAAGTDAADAETAGAAPSADTGKAVYDKACFACHAQGIAGAPKHADMAAWEARLDQGVATLYDHAINGYTGDAGMMPARGGNPSLSDAEVKAAVDYMIAAVGGGNGSATDEDEGNGAPTAEPEAATASQDDDAETGESDSASTDEAESAAADQDQDQQTAAAQDEQGETATAAEATADNGRGKEVYDSACFVCHTPGAAGAPKLSDTAAWKTRLEKGIEALYHSSINGFMGDAGMMPPKGGRPDFSDEDVKAAVDYMVSGAR